MRLREHAPPARVARGAGHEVLGLVPADGVHAASAQACEFADAQRRGVLQEKGGGGGHAVHSGAAARELQALRTGLQSMIKTAVPTQVHRTFAGPGVTDLLLLLQDAA